MRPELVRRLEHGTEGALLARPPRESRAGESVHTSGFTEHTSGAFSRNFTRATLQACFMLCVLVVVFSLSVWLRSRTSYQTSLSASCASGPSGLSPGVRRKGITSCTCWRNEIQSLWPTFTGVLQAQPEETKVLFRVVMHRQMFITLPSTRKICL